MRELKIQTTNITDKEVFVFVDGFIETDTAEQFGNYIKKIHTENLDKKIIIDFSKVEMITSAGIRYLIMFQKEKYNFELTNVSREVFTVFKLTGVEGIIDIEQKTYSINTEGCKMLGRGFHSEVYRLDDETIAKVYYDIPNIDMAIRERMIAKQAFVKGVPTEISFGMCESNGKPGLIYELVDANTLLSLFAEDDKNMDLYIKDYVKLIKTMHTFTGDGITGIYDKKADFESDSKLVSKYIPKECYEKIVKVGESIPYSNKLLHGDPHPANVMLTDKGLIFIDLSDVGIGDEKFDLMFLYRTLKLFPILPTNKYALNKERAALLWDKFIKEYYKDEDPKYVEEELKKIKVLGLNSIVYRFCNKNPESEEAKIMIKLLVDELEKM